ncbi:hypothetical protein HJ149_23245 [Vibrio parahaemolyticus]|nr:hypothetical protein [Vibrio parahaemolyticus]MBE3941621.1 hypothetical protein [Vibrio parahaemolyticus]
MTKKYTSMRITEERKIKLERAAIEVSYATGKQIKWTDLANHLFDEYVAEAKKRHERESREIRETLKFRS